ncbi:MAG: DUF2834 domain-containing protein [Spirochaetota bacterium]
MKKIAFLVLALLGIVLPMSQFIPASIDGEFTVAGMFAEMTATRTITGVTFDFMVVVVTAIVFGAWEAFRLKIRLAWIPLLGTFLFGASFGLPFFLYLRERAIVREAMPRAGRE